MFNTLSYRVIITLFALLIGLLNYPSEVSTFAFMVFFIGLFFIMESLIPNIKRKFSILGTFSIFFIVVCAVTFIAG